MKMTKLAFTGIAIVGLALQLDAVPGGWVKMPYRGMNSNITVRTSTRTLNRASSFKSAPKKMLMASTLSAAQNLDGLGKSLPVAESKQIAELARGLDHDWLKCFDFVRNNIRFVPYPGIMRGPDRTLIDMEGNDADQAFLLVALLKASGYSWLFVHDCGYSFAA